jgi:enamine deaminase RidA (YjgF/YER057c/UK114 family)
VSTIDDRLKTLGIVLPSAPRAVANYVPYVLSGNLLVVSGQLPMVRGELAFEGKVGAEVDLKEAGDAAAICAVNILAQVKAAIHDMDKVVQVVRLGGFVNCVDTFEEQPGVINRASDLMVEVFGDRGRHARSAVGVNALPLGAPVEIDAMFEVDAG